MNALRNAAPLHRRLHTLVIPHHAGKLSPPQRKSPTLSSPFLRFLPPSPTLIITTPSRASRFRLRSAVSLYVYRLRDKSGGGVTTRSQPSSLAATSGIATIDISATTTGESRAVVSNLNVANALTATRLLAAPVSAYYILQEAYDHALLTLLLAGVSDFLDGFVARRWQLRTVLGSFLDPAADKMLMLSVGGALAFQGIIPIWLAALIVARDAAIVGGYAALVRAGGRHGGWGLRWGGGGSCGGRGADGIAIVGGGGGGSGGGGVVMADCGGGAAAVTASPVSKVNTGVQIALAVTGVLHGGGWEIASADVVQAVGLATAVTTVASGVVYGRMFLRRMGSVAA